MALDLMVDALSPTNFLPTNPAALQQAFDTAGASLLKGARNFVGDVINNGGKPRQVDPAASRWASTWPARRQRWCTATS